MVVKRERELDAVIKAKLTGKRCTPVHCDPAEC